jgi:hypothetical protein
MALICSWGKEKGRKRLLVDINIGLTSRVRDLFGRHATGSTKKAKKVILKLPMEKRRQLKRAARSELR